MTENHLNNDSFDAIVVYTLGVMTGLGIAMLTYAFAAGAI